MPQHLPRKLGFRETQFCRRSWDARRTARKIVQSRTGAAQARRARRVPTRLHDKSRLLWCVLIRAKTSRCVRGGNRRWLGWWGLNTASEEGRNIGGNPRRRCGGPVKRVDLAVLVHQEFRKIPGQRQHASSLSCLLSVVPQKVVHRVRLRTVDMNLLKHSHLRSVSLQLRLDKLTDVVRTASFLVAELIAGKACHFEWRLSVLLKEISKLSIVFVS
mmetsp:Transcript_2911/g.6604  ORF Transcript_2911/g.6604 Transcript_2911/m.6604 type:complete len:216 (+) Transcript_2911:222-869(+)